MQVIGYRAASKIFCYQEHISEGEYLPLLLKIVTKQIYMQLTFVNNNKPNRSELHALNL